MKKFLVLPYGTFHPPTRSGAPGANGSPPQGRI